MELSSPPAVKESKREGSLRRLAPIGGWLPGRASRLVFAGGLLVYLLVQVGLVLLPAVRREAPVETDDAYTYILKAEQVLACFRQDCPALQDLRLQLQAPAGQPEVEWLRYREYHRSFVVYHPLHSVLLALLHALGLSWESAYDALAVAGALLIGLGVAFWLYVLWGPGPAGLALGLLAFTLFPGQGLHYVVPGNLALGLALLTWAWIVRRREQAGWGMAAGIAAMLAMHSTGRLYALVALALFGLLAWLQAGRRFSRAAWRAVWAPAGVGLLLIALAFLLPQVVSRPDLAVRPDPPPQNWTFQLGLRDNFAEAFGILRQWIEDYGGYTVLGALLIVGLLSTPRRRWLPILALAAILAGLLAASLFYVLPRYPAEAFGRIWIPTAILLTGLIARAAWGWLAALWGWLARFRRAGAPELADPRRLLTPRGWTLALLLILGISLAQYGLANILRGAAAAAGTARIMTEKQHLRLEPAQPARLLSEGCGRTLYMAELPMHFYFSRGALACGAVFYPALAGTPEEAVWLSGEDAGLEYGVAWNPVVEPEAPYREGSLALAPYERLEIRTSPAEYPLNRLAIAVDNPGPEVTLVVHLLEPKKARRAGPLRLQVPAGWSGWLALPAEGAAAVAAWQVEAPRARHTLRLRGLRLDPASPLYWPWDSGAVLTHIPAGTSEVAPREIRFETAALFPGLPWPARILEDGGDTVLAELVR